MTSTDFIKWATREPAQAAKAIDEMNRTADDLCARIAELEQALREIEQNAGKCVALEQANWTIERIKQRAAAALK